MADSTVVHLGENSPEEVAHKLMHEVMRLERRASITENVKAGWTPADRKYLLDTYAECLAAIRQPFDRAPSYSRS